MTLKNPHIKYLLIGISQLITATIVVFLGWEIGSMIYAPQGSNWMWILEMQHFVLILGVLSAAGCLALYWLFEKTNWAKYIFIVQILIITVYCLQGWSYRPLRNTFLWVCALIVFGVGVLLNRYIKVEN